MKAEDESRKAEPFRNGKKQKTKSKKQNKKQKGMTDSMGKVSTAYTVEVEPSDSDNYRLEIIRIENKVMVNVRHTHYNGKAETTSEGIALPLETFKELIDTIWAGI